MSTNVEYVNGWTIEYREHGALWLTHPDGTRFSNPNDPIVPAAVRRRIAPEYRSPTPDPRRYHGLIGLG